MDVVINWWAVLFAAVANMLVGSVWYAKPVFGNVWTQLVKLNEKQMREKATMSMIGAFVMAVMTAFVLAHVTFISAAYFNVSFMESALNTAFWLWLGISLTTIVTHGLFEQRRKKLIALTAAHQLVSFIVMGFVIGLIGS